MLDVVRKETGGYWRGLAGYLMEFQFQDMLKFIARELDIPRAAEELSTLDSQSRLKFPLSVPDGLVLPETLSIDSLNAYINVHMRSMHDFDTGYPADNSHAWVSKATEKVEYPYHWFKAPVHFHVVHDDSFLGDAKTSRSSPDDRGRCKSLVIDVW